MAKDILNAALKALLAGAETSAWVKIPATFIAEIASLPEDKRDALDTASMGKFDELLTQAELSTTNAAVAAVGTEQIKVLVSNLARLSADKLELLTKLTQDQYEETVNQLIAIHKNTEEIKTGIEKNHLQTQRKLDEIMGRLDPGTLNNEQKLQLEKEIQLYGELWKALADVRSSIIITPTLDKMPKGKSPYDVYKDRCDTAIDTFNNAKNIFENNRPFYHDDVSKITKEFLGRCRGYIFKVQKALSSGKFDDKLHDEADELLEIIPKAIDEIEKTIKIRIGLLPKSDIAYCASIGPGLGSIVEITNGSITYHSNTLNFKPLMELKTSIIGGYVKRNDFGKLEAYIQTDVQVQSLQRLNEKLGLDAMRLLSESGTISEDIDNPVVFTSSTSRILPEGEMVLNLSTWQEVPFPMNMHVQTQTTASGYLKGKVFQGKFEAILIYHEINLQVGLNGDFHVHLA